MLGTAGDSNLSSSFFRLPKSARVVFTCCQCSVTQLTRPCSGCSRLRPSPVSSYSTRSGTSGNSSLVSSPSLSTIRCVSVNILWETPGMALSSSVNRARRPGIFARVRIKNMLHFSPTLVSSSRTAAGSSELLGRRLVEQWYQAGSSTPVTREQKSSRRS